MVKRLKVTIVILLFATIFVASSCNRFRKAPPPSNASPSPQPSTRLPSPAGFVNDYANVIDDESESRLEELVTKLKAVSNIEFAVVTVDTTNGEPIFDYSLAVAKEWGVGPKNPSEGGGLLFLLAVKDRKWHLQVGRALEKDLPNDVAKTLGDESTPLYKQGNYSGGIEKYVKSIIDRLEKQRKFSLQ